MLKFYLPSLLLSLFLVYFVKAIRVKYIKLQIKKGGEEAKGYSLLYDFYTKNRRKHNRIIFKYGVWGFSILYFCIMMALLGSMLPP